MSGRDVGMVVGCVLGLFIRLNVRGSELAVRR